MDNLRAGNNGVKVKVFSGEKFLSVIVVSWRVVLSTFKSNPRRNKRVEKAKTVEKKIEKNLWRKENRQGLEITNRTRKICE